MPHHCIFGRIYLAIEENLLKESDTCDFYYFAIDPSQHYHSFCDDFGPINLYSTHEFCKELDACLQREAETKIAVSVPCDESSITNAVFLLGAYLVKILGVDPSIVTQSFQSLQPYLLSYRDISPGRQTFDLRLEDCWEALYRARQLEWLKVFDAEEYLHFDSPLNADLHVIVPNKIIAMKGPKTLEDGLLWQDNSDGGRDFSPAYIAEILNDFDVKLVLRLNEPTYKDEDFAASGIAVADLFFEDCSLPPSNVVVKFLLMLENLPGAAAVHCKAGLGRTGTLIALYLMKNFAFTARQAIAWLRIVRPGSVIGRQQQYLCDLEARMNRLRGHPMSGPYATSSPPCANSCCIDAVRSMMEVVHLRVNEGQRRSKNEAPM